MRGNGPAAKAIPNVRGAGPNGPQNPLVGGGQMKIGCNAASTDRSSSGENLGHHTLLDDLSIPQMLCPLHPELELEFFCFDDK